MEVSIIEDESWPPLGFKLLWSSPLWNVNLSLQKKEYFWGQLDGMWEGSGWTWGKTKRLFMQFTPYSWSDWDWYPANDPFSALMPHAVWLACMVLEVNSFFLINVLRLPRAHYFNFLRQFLMLWTAGPVAAEWYEYCKGRMPRLGHCTWLMGMNCLIETSFVLKPAGG